MPQILMLDDKAVNFECFGYNLVDITKAERVSDCSPILFVNYPQLKNARYVHYKEPKLLSEAEKKWFKVDSEYNCLLAFPEQMLHKLVIKEQQEFPYIKAVISIKINAKWKISVVDDYINYEVDVSKCYSGDFFDVKDVLLANALSILSSSNNTDADNEDIIDEIRRNILYKLKHWKDIV